MIGFRLAAQRPPDAQKVNSEVVMRFEHVYEVNPELMTEHIQQHDFPAWDTKRIGAARWDYLDWMHDHWADQQVSGEELMGEAD